MKFILPTVLILLAAACTSDNSIRPAQTKLVSVTQYLQNNQGDFRPAEKIEYTYEPSGQLSSERQSQYDITVQSYYLFSYTSYTYKNNLVDRIEKQILGNPNKTVTTYTYSSNKVSRINVDDEVDTQADVAYRGDTVEVKYNQSNGRFFTYRFAAKNGNISYEKTIDDSNRLSSESSHQYDNAKNPLTLLGYTDLFFLNYSSNNKVKSTSSYYTSSFPTSTPVKYEYEYNEKNYPVTQITTYQSTGSGASGKVKTVFEYN